MRVRSGFEALLRQLHERAWVVYAKRPFADAAAVVGYLGRYTHRVALSNRRLVAFDGKSVRFSGRTIADRDGTERPRSR